MPGMLYYSFAEGNRCEPFAEYILSSVAAVTRVPHEKDIGFDLLCTLMHYEDPNLYAGKSFGIQVKSINEKYRITYGGFSKDDPTKGKEYEIEWLKNQDQPLFICLVNLKSFTVELFSTDRIWPLFWETPNPGEIKFVLNKEPEQYVNSKRYFPREKIPNGNKLGDGYSYKVMLGKPFCKISLREISKNEYSEDHDYRKELEKKINHELDLSYDNLLYRNLKLPYSKQRVLVDDPTLGQGRIDSDLFGNLYLVSQESTKERVDLVLLSIWPVIDYLMRASWDNQREEDTIFKFLKIVLDRLMLEVNRQQMNKGKLYIFGNEYNAVKILQRTRLDELNKLRKRKRKQYSFRRMFSRMWLRSKSNK